MRILITGVSGFVGSRLAKKLLKAGHTVIGVSRSNPRIRGVDVIKADITKWEDVKRIRKKFDVVYHLAAELDESSPKLWEVNVTGTKNMLELVKNRSIKRFIYLSSLGVLGETKEPAMEDMPYNPKTKYERSKAEAERMITYYWLKYNIPYTILRATIILGPNKTWEKIFKAAKEGYPIIGSGANYWHLVYVDDVISALTKALSPVARNKIYHIAGPDALTYEEVYRIICKKLKVKTPKERVAPHVAKVYAMAHEIKAKISGRNPEPTMMRSSIDRLIRNRISSIERAKKELGWRPRWPTEKAIERTVELLKKGGEYDTK